MILASPKPIDLRLATLIKRFSNRKISTHFFGMADILDRTIPFKRELYQQQLTTERTPPVNTDLQPTAYFHASLHWLAISSPTLSRYLLKIAAFSNDHRWLFWAGGFLLTLLWRLARGKSGGTGIALFLAGLIGMALEITILLAHQEFRGVVYQDLGMLLAAFMLGLTMGAPLGHWLFIRWPGGALSSAFSGTWSVSWIILLIFKFADQWALTSIFWFIVPLLLLGISIGACYSPASAMMAHRLKERAAAHAYAWDIGGAAIGALFISAFILPLLGLPGSCWLCAALASGWLVGQMILLCKK
jgi:spermidine synthase